MTEATSTTTQQVVRIEAPAKINLGLELLGKRPDGYHEIRTVMAMIDLVDHLSIERRANSGQDVSGVDLRGEQNLIAVARDAYSVASGVCRPVHIDVTKHIPIGAGLGGASTDAAATLMGLDALTPPDQRLSAEQLATAAASVGSDVPFFLGPPLALASGTGATIAPLPLMTVSWWVLLVSPPIELPRKTATLYGMIDAADFTDGTRTDELMADLTEQRCPAFGPELLANPFRQAWNRLGDPISPLEQSLIAAGATWTALSGAGPTVYTLVDDPERAGLIVERLRTRIPATVAINLVPLRSRSMRIEPPHATAP